MTAATSAHKIEDDDNYIQELHWSDPPRSRRIADALSCTEPIDVSVFLASRSAGDLAQVEFPQVVISSRLIFKVVDSSSSILSAGTSRFGAGEDKTDKDKKPTGDNPTGGNR